jgi:PAS domain S-box-containing protein
MTKRGTGTRLEAIAADLEHVKSELLRSEEKYRTLVASHGDSMAIYDFDTATAIEANQATLDLFGYTLAEFCGLRGKDLHPESAWPEVDAISTQLRETGRAHNPCSRCRKKDGTEFWGDCRITVFEAGGKKLMISIVRDVTTMIETERQLRASEARSRVLMAGTLRAQEEERRRVAQELHDALGQLLTNLGVQLRAVENLDEAAPLRARLASLRELTQGIIGEVSNLAHRLRPPALDELGLAMALGQYAADFARLHELRVDLHIGRLIEHPRLDPDQETALYRIVQEALTNVVKHARAHAVSVLLDKRGDSVRLVIEDDGVGVELDPRTGLPAGPKGLGVTGMRERATLLGGTLQLESTPGAGLSVFVTLPVQPVAAEAPAGIPRPS